MVRDGRRWRNADWHLSCELVSGDKRKDAKPEFIMQRSTLVAYALPALPLAALTLPLYVLVPTFYTETLGLSLASVGAALLFVRMFDALNDPLIGIISDRWQPAFGRRRAMFALSLPVTALAAWMLFWPPDNPGPAHLIIWGSLLSIGQTMALVPYSAWGAELEGGYDARSRIAGYREGLTLVGTLVAIALPFTIGITSSAGVHGLAAMAIFVALALPALGLFAVWRVPEPVNYTKSRIALLPGLKALSANRPFMRLIAAFFLNGLANGIPATLFLYFVSSVLKAEAMRGPLLFLYFACGIAGVPLALYLAKRFGKHRAWCGAMLITCLAFAFAPLLGPGDAPYFAVISIVTGLALGFDLSLPASIQADVIDIDTLHSGEQRSGLYFAAWSLSTKLSLALGVGLVFPILEFAGFNPNVPNSGSPAALLTLAALYAWVPVALKLIAIKLMWNFPIDRAAQDQTRRQIEAAA
jgi:glycoside/pentoside/hexuronide:cation symporter, GPH family